MKTINKAIAESILADLGANGLLHPKANYIYVKEALNYRLKLLQDAFPSNCLHAIAIKTCNHPLVLNYIARLGFGLEAASIEEVKLAQDAGVHNTKIVFDSPVKTHDEILFCHNHAQGALINVNCLEEIERYPSNFNCKLGLRINPLIDVKTDKNLNVSKLTSKFGVPLTEKKAILNVLAKHPNFTALHFHIGSGLSEYKANLTAFEVVHNIAGLANIERLKNGLAPIDTIDIGGGIDFELNNNQNDVQAFAQQINKLNKGAYKLVTEFGKFVHQTAAFVESKIEYITKNTPQLYNAFIHIGADLFLRKIYSNMAIDYPCHVVGKSNLEVQNYRLVGPLCFAGDVIYENIALPLIEVGDQIILLNTGANTLSMWSNHCSREPINFLIV